MLRLTVPVVELHPAEVADPLVERGLSALTQWQAAQAGPTGCQRALGSAARMSCERVWLACSHWHAEVQVSADGRGLHRGQEFAATAYGETWEHAHLL